MDSAARRFTLILNPAARGGRTAAARGELEAASARRGLDATLVECESGQHATALAAKATAEARIAVACGGDGLVRDVAQGVVERGGTMAIVPLGTGNDIARSIGLVPRHIEGAMALLAEGRVRRIDVGRAGDQVFCGVATVGFGSAANQWSDRQRWHSGGLVYALAVLRTLLHYRPHGIVLETDAGTERAAGWIAAIANGPFVGGGMQIAPDAALDDGLFDVVILGPVNRPTFVSLFVKVYRGRHMGHPAVGFRRLAALTLDVAGPGACREVYADGEPIGTLPLTFRTEPAALAIIVPPSDAPGGP